jgi:lysophospholipase L1-like esterase
MDRHVVRVLTAAVLLGGIIAGSAIHRATAASVISPKAYYLALGDSLAFGYQPNFDWSHGYASDFASDLKTHGSTSSVNYGCSGETAATFINGGCPYQNILMLHNYYTGPQLNAALNFINGHSGKVSPVTIDIGANDLKSLINTSTCQVADYTTPLATFDSNFQYILTKLSTALAGRGTILVMNYYDPYQNQCPNTVPVVQTFNQHIANDASAVATAQNTIIPVADVFTAFGGATTPNPAICADTWMCSSYNDIHANRTGYAMIARVFEAAYGY